MTEAFKQTKSETSAPQESTPPQGADTAILCARLLDERRLRDILVFDVGDILQIAGYFVIGTGTSSRQLERTADHLAEKMREFGISRVGAEGRGKAKGSGEARWVLFDFGEVVVHLMLEEARQYYNLELLWGDCPQITWQGDGA